MSDFLDDLKQFSTSLWRSTRKGVDKLAVNIDQRTEVAKLAAKLRRLDKERSEVIERIGKKVYALHQKGKVQNADILADCETIDDLAALMQATEDRIEDIRRGGRAELEVPQVTDETPLAPEAEEMHVPVEAPEEEEPEQPSEPDLPQTPPEPPAHAEEADEGQGPAEPETEPEPGEPEASEPEPQQDDDQQQD